MRSGTVRNVNTEAQNYAKKSNNIYIYVLNLNVTINPKHLLLHKACNEP